MPLKLDPWGRAWSPISHLVTILINIISNSLLMNKQSLKELKFCTDLQLKLDKSFEKYISSLLILNSFPRPPVPVDSDDEEDAFDASAPAPDPVEAPIEVRFKIGRCHFKIFTLWTFNKIQKFSFQWSDELVSQGLGHCALIRVCLCSSARDTCSHL